MVFDTPTAPEIGSSTWGGVGMNVSPPKKNERKRSRYLSFLRVSHDTYHVNSKTEEANYLPGTKFLFIESMLLQGKGAGGGTLCHACP